MLQKQIMIRITPEQWEELMKQAKKDDRTISSLLRMIIGQWLSSQHSPLLPSIPHKNRKV
jgi:hypothetical protein